MSNETYRKFQVSTRVTEDDRKFLTAYAENCGFKTKTGFPSMSMSVYDIICKFKKAWPGSADCDARECAAKAVTMRSDNIPPLTDHA